MLALALLAGSGVVAGCEARNSTGGGARGEVLETTASQSSSEDAIDVSTDSKLALSLRGSVGPIISGQTLTKATVTMSNLELVDGSGGSVALSGNGFQADILGLQNQVGQLFPAQPVKAGRYTALRFRLKNAWVVAQDANGALTAYASPEVDKSQFSQGTTVQTLDFGGLDTDGSASCAVAPGGVVLGDVSTLALQFALAQSLATSSSSVWVLTPVCWVVDPFAYSSLDVNLAPASGDSADDKDLANGFQVMLLDSNLWPISEVALASSQSATYSAHFADLQSFQGPFVAALLPPDGYQLQSGVAFSIDLQPSAKSTASISVTSLQVVSGRLLDVATADHCSVVQRDQTGNVLAKTSQPIGAVKDVAPTTHHDQPVPAGRQPLAPAPTPHLPGNPAP
jgi:hypothetical protein